MPIIDFLRTAGRNFRKLDGEFGIEIETESKKEYITPNFSFWESHGDGSLRDFGIEYVLRQPVKYNKELDQALEEFRVKTADIKFIPDSVTTSVHVHVNMLNESFKTMGNFLTLYALFENLLIRYSGEDRRSNLFCLPMCDAEETYRIICELFKHVSARNWKGLALQENQVKYAACNLATLWKFGSVELRSFRGETDVQKIKNWITIIYRMLQYARQDINPKTVMMSWKDRQLMLLNDVFTDYRPEIKHVDELKLIEKNTWYAACIAFSVRDWNNIDEPIKIPDFKPKQKELDAVSLQLFAEQHFENLIAADQQHVLHYLQKQHNIKYGIDPKMFIAPAPERIRWDGRGRPQVVNPANEIPLDPQPGEQAAWAVAQNRAVNDLMAMRVEREQPDQLQRIAQNVLNANRQDRDL